MAHIAFFVIPFTGHVNPTLAVAAELVARGHRVSYTTSEEFADRVRRAGAVAVPYRTVLGSEPATAFADRTSFTADDLARHLRWQLADAVATLPAFAAAFDRDRPDVVVADPACWAGVLLARRLRVPLLRSQPVFAANEHWSLAAGHATPAGPHAGLAALTRGIARLLDWCGAGIGVDEFLGGEGDLTLVYVPRAFQYAGDTFDDRFRFVGPCVGSRDGTWRPPGDRRPVALVSLGTVHNRQLATFRRCLEAFADGQWRLVVAFGGPVPDELAGIAPHAELHSYVPQRDVLRHADVFVNHGGTGTVMEGLAAGVPTVVVPQMAEHRATADRVVALGLGRLIAPDELTPRLLRRAVDAVVADEAVHAGLRWMRQEIHAAGGARAAADFVEQAA
ncbi:macrolide family glycosyltransferase [Kutzneria buriramensis]|uniref:Demethyllactenocin mycarosyltransferase n=1 Tax=Kutzneria buriramensis TaxID=1045776 RepID=A0A3E0H1J2_9PSEU|nr:macrolide family glycosyltransferase [Kutzneria buriramensis]REH35696.1 demethyllactenocin mycarosyltransferase [Kutzneria buriramensis]